MGCLNAVIPDAVAAAARPRQRPVRGRVQGARTRRRRRGRSSPSTLERVLVLVPWFLDGGSD